MDSQQQQQQQQQQPNVAPAQPQQAYHPVTNDGIQPVQQPNTEHALPPSYDQANQAKNAPANQPGNMAGAPPATVIPLNMLSEQPQWIDCPFCHQRTTTTVRREGTSMQIVVGALLCLLCVCLTCVPCLAGWFEDTHYSCSHCKNVVAIRRHDGPIEVFGPTMPVYSQYSGNQPPMNDQQPLQQQQQQQQQHQEQYPMHDLQPQIQQQQQPVTQPGPKN